MRYFQVNISYTILYLTSLKAKELLMRKRDVISLSLIVLLVSFIFSGCATSSGSGNEVETYATGKALEEEGYHQGAIAMYSSAVSFQEIGEETLRRELDRMLMELGQKAFDKALEEAYKLLEHIRQEGLKEGDDFKVRTNDIAIKALQFWEQMRGTAIWKTVGAAS